MDDKQGMEGVVFSIQRFSIHDGPGIRTTVFLKGCSLRCFWCHNPEGIRLKPDIQFFPDRCIGCDECIRICQHGAALIINGTRVYDREKCVVCGECVETCYAGARVLTGKVMSVESVVAEVLQDRAFYETSKGGVTLSGGEPVLQPQFSYNILAQCKAAGLHTAIETCGNVRWEEEERMLPVTDLLMMDIKHMDSAKHRWATGAPNERILAAARKFALTDKPIIFRIPVIPTVNDTVEEVMAIATFVRELITMRNQQGDDGDHTITLELLPFHRLAGDKYRSLDMDYRARDLKTPSKEHMAALTEAARMCAVDARSR
jgi:pyruvate formate lyase activating enzyme